MLSAVLLEYNVRDLLLAACALFPFLFIIHLDNIDRDISFSSGVSFGKCNVWRLLFADDFALLSDLNYALDCFSDACLDAGMKLVWLKLRLFVCQGTLSSVLSKQLE